jgi:hypothetical protein
LNRTLSHEDSEEIGKGIDAVSNEWLNGYEPRFGSGLSPYGSDPVLSGRTRLNGSDSASLRRCAPTNCWDAALASWATRAWGDRLGRAEDSAQKPNSNKNTFFFFKTILEIINQFEFKSNFNFNDFYSHNKIQEHFITPRKICNDMNAPNNYLFKYITL